MILVQQSKIKPIKLDPKSVSFKKSLVWVTGMVQDVLKVREGTIASCLCLLFYIRSTDADFTEL